MAKANRTCHTCGNEYYYCPSCPVDKRDPQIYVMWCGEKCKKIFNLLSDETFKRITTAECKEELVNLGVTLRDTFKDGVKVHAERVLNYKEPVVNIEITKEADVIETVENIAVEATEFKHKKKRKNSEVD